MDSSLWIWANWTGSNSDWASVDTRNETSICNSYAKLLKQPHKWQKKHCTNFWFRVYCTFRQLLHYYRVVIIQLLFQVDFLTVICWMLVKMIPTNPTKAKVTSGPFFIKKKTNSCCYKRGQQCIVTIQTDVRTWTGVLCFHRWTKWWQRSDQPVWWQQWWVFPVSSVFINACLSGWLN